MLHVRFSRAWWSHCATESSTESKTPGRTEVGIDLISKITAVFSHRHDRSPSVSPFLPSFLSRLPFSHPISTGKESRSCRRSKRRSRKRKRGRERANTSTDVDRLSRETLRKRRPRWRLESNLPAHLARIELGSTLYKKRGIRKESSLTARPLWSLEIAARHSNRFDSRNIPLSISFLASARKSFSNRPLIKSTLTPLSPVSVESASEKVLWGNIWKYPRRSRASEQSKNRMHRYSLRTCATPRRSS